LAIDADRFGLDRYLLNQKVISLGGKYHVYDEAGEPILYVDRPVFRLQAHVGIYADESNGRKLLTVFQDSAFQLINLSFTLLDDNDRPIAFMKREGWASMLRHTWTVYDGAGRLLVRAVEDSWWKALLRRVPYLEDVARWIHTNYALIFPDGRPAGAFVRRFTIADKYALDLTPDAERALDRRIAIALAVLLDNAKGVL